MNVQKTVVEILCNTRSLLDGLDDGRRQSACGRILNVRDCVLLAVLGMWRVTSSEPDSTGRMLAENPICRRLVRMRRYSQYGERLALANVRGAQIVD